GTRHSRRSRNDKRRPAQRPGRRRQAGPRHAQSRSRQTRRTQGSGGGDERVIVCKQCGHHNEDSDTFCGSCGKFLEWSGERVVVAQPEPEPAPAAEPEPEPARLGFMDRVKQAVGMEDEAPPPAATVEAPAAPPPLTAAAV